MMPGGSRGGLQYALAQLHRGQLDGAIETLRQVLAEDPQSETAHAILALCLVDKKRLYAAEHEGKIALSLAPNSALAHRAFGSALLAQRKWKRAQEHLETARSLAPNDPVSLRVLARLHRLTGQRHQALPLLEQALSLDPEDTDTIVAIGQHHLEQGNLAEAEGRAHTALEIKPGDLEAVVLMGHVLLVRGQVAHARELALWALSMRATDEGALHLLTAVKARESWGLGLWWRWNSWMGTLADSKQTLIFIGVFIAYRAARIALLQSDHPNAASFVLYAWLGVCVYTWVAPAMFIRMLKRELSQVRLRPSF